MSHPYRAPGERPSYPCHTCAEEQDLRDAERLLREREWAAADSKWDQLELVPWWLQAIGWLVLWER